MQSYLRKYTQNKETLKQRRKFEDEEKNECIVSVLFTLCIQGGVHKSLINVDFLSVFFSISQSSKNLFEQDFR